MIAKWGLFCSFGLCEEFTIQIMHEWVYGPIYGKSVSLLEEETFFFFFCLINHNIVFILKQYLFPFLVCMDNIQSVLVQTCSFCSFLCIPERYISQKLSKKRPGK